MNASTSVADPDSLNPDPAFLIQVLHFLNLFTVTLGMKKFRCMSSLPCLSRMFSGSAFTRVNLTLSPAIHLKLCLPHQATFALKDFVDQAQICLLSSLLKGGQTKFQ
jgi:hypothetical protein